MLLSFVQTFIAYRDTVSAVGVFSHANPAYSSINYSAKHVRHALALDEKRARFRPDMWCEPLPGREHELDIDFPIHEHGGSKGKRDDWGYTPPDRDYADVKEVWFAGDLTLANVSEVTYDHQVPMQTLVETLNGTIRVYNSYLCAG
jgi:uncharacterized protein (DUF2235 family)